MITEHRPRRWPHASRTIDGVIIGLLALSDLWGMEVRSLGYAIKSPPLVPLGLLLAMVGAGLFWWRRERPVAVLWSTLLVTVVASVPYRVPLFSESTGIATMLAVYAVGSWARPRPLSIATPLVFFLGLCIIDVGITGLGVAIAIAAAIVALPWVAGYAVRTRRLYVEEVEERLITAEHERDERANRAARDERAHIARELHDIVAHHVSVIGVQAGAARVALAASPDETRASLLAIETASRDAVREMRHLLSALRGSDDGAGPWEAPQPGLNALPGLVESFHAAGLTIELLSNAGATVLPPSLDLCCYRIVEEALTNVTRHSTARRASVTVDVQPERVHLRVSDPGPAAARPGTGRGHVGMRERVALFGGVLRLGPETADGFIVDAMIPRHAGRSG